MRMNSNHFLHVNEKKNYSKYNLIKFKLLIKIKIVIVILEKNEVSTKIIIVNINKSFVIIFFFKWWFYLA